MLECVHQKILITIQGLPTRCPSVALTSLLGSRDIHVSSFISQQQLTFINSITSMSPTDLPRLILQQRLTSPSLSGIIPDGNNFWTISTFHPLNSCYPPQGALTEECPDLPIGYCNLPLHDRKATTRTNFRVRMLVGCDGLEADASRFRRRMNGTVLARGVKAALRHTYIIFPPVTSQYQLPSDQA